MLSAAFLSNDFLGATIGIVLQWGWNVHKSAKLHARSFSTPCF